MGRARWGQRKRRPADRSLLVPLEPAGDGYATHLPLRTELRTTDARRSI